MLMTALRLPGCCQEPLNTGLNAVFVVPAAAGLSCAAFEGFAEGGRVAALDRQVKPSSSSSKLPTHHDYCKHMAGCQRIRDQSASTILQRSEHVGSETLIVYPM
jgi:hypothetical protein